MFAAEQPADTATNMQGSGTMSDTMRLPDDLVGLIIGRGGENIMRMQRETGCRIQITQSIPGTKERPCTLSGTQEQIEVCRNMLHEIISRSKAGGGISGTVGNGIGAMGDGPNEKNVEMQIPADKCGLIIGKGGETIKMLQQSLQVKMLLIQDSTENLGQPKPLRISGVPGNVENAVNAVNQMMAQRDAQIAQQKLEGRSDGMNGIDNFGDDTSKTTVPVPKAAVGVVIGKGGDMINQIQDQTGTRIQFKPEEPMMPDRICTVSGSKEGVEHAIRKIQEIISNVQERDGITGGNNTNFGHWEGPNMRGMMGNHIIEDHLVPANRAGLVIGKGGETIKQINAQSGAHAEIVKNPPAGSDPNYKQFTIKGTPDQIKVCRQLIQEKVDSGPGGNMSSNIRNNQSLSGYQPQFGMQTQFPGPQLGGPPMSNPQPLQGQFAQNQWNQFQQWTPPSTVTTPPQNGAGMAAGQPDYSKEWSEYLKNMAAPVGGASAAQITPASLQQAAQPQAPGAAGGATDYSAQWAEYYRQLYAVQQQQQYAQAAQQQASGQT